MSSPSPESERVFVATPLEQDARVIARVLGDAGLAYTCCARVTDLPEAFPAEAGALLLTEEALSQGAPRHLARRLATQPDWSRLPVVLLVSEGRRGRAARRALHDACAAGAHLTALERPLRASTLRAVAETALQHRRRQRDVAALLHRLAEKGDTLEDEVAARTDALRERGAQVRSLAEALTRAEQRERRRLSRLLHDHLQQLLYGMKVHTERLRTGPALRGHERRTPPDRDGVLDELDAVADEAIALTRTLAIELDPPVLGDEGLAAALAWLTTQMRERHHLRVSLDAPEAPFPAEPSDELRALLFRLTRELLFNVAKHAGTPHAAITLRADGDAIVLTVTDDGCGFDPAAVPFPTAAASGDAPDALAGREAGTGLGLFSVRERLALFGGDMTLEGTAPGQGTRVALTVPVR